VGSIIFSFENVHCFFRFAWKKEGSGVESWRRFRTSTFNFDKSCARLEQTNCSASSSIVHRSSKQLHTLQTVHFLASSATFPAKFVKFDQMNGCRENVKDVRTTGDLQDPSRYLRKNISSILSVVLVLVQSTTTKIPIFSLPHSYRHTRSSSVFLRNLLVPAVSC